MYRLKEIEITAPSTTLSLLAYTCPSHTGCAKQVCPVMKERSLLLFADSMCKAKVETKTKQKQKS